MRDTLRFQDLLRNGDFNRIYLEDRTLNVKLLGQDFTWRDTGTHESLVDATNFVKTVEKHQYRKVVCLEEIAYLNGRISGVLRRLHFQKNFLQMKLVRVIKGAVFDVAVDLRSGSEIYGKWYGIELTEENKKQFLISRGFAHGFLVLSNTAEFCYKCDDFYHPNDEGGMTWNDSEIGIVWPQVVGKYEGSASAICDVFKFN